MMQRFSSEFRWVLLFCSLPLIVIPLAMFGGRIIIWYGHQWNKLAASIRHRLTYWHIAIHIVLLVPIVVILSQLILQPDSKFNFWLLITVIAIPIMGALYMVLELYVVSRHIELQKSSWDLSVVDTFGSQAEDSPREKPPAEAIPIDYGMTSTSPVILVAIGILAILLFAVLGFSLFIPGITGIIGTAASAFGLAFLASAVRRTKPSHLWQAVVIGLCVGAVLSVLFVRARSLQPDHSWNQWATFIAMPVAGVCGKIVATSKWAAMALDWICYG